MLVLSDVASSRLSCESNDEASLLFSLTWKLHWWKTLGILDDFIALSHTKSKRKRVATLSWCFMGIRVSVLPTQSVLSSISKRGPPMRISESRCIGVSWPFWCQKKDVGVSRLLACSLSRLLVWKRASSDLIFVQLQVRFSGESSIPGMSHIKSMRHRHGDKDRDTSVSSSQGQKRKKNRKRKDATLLKCHTSWWCRPQLALGHPGCDTVSQSRDLYSTWSLLQCHFQGHCLFVSMPQYTRWAPLAVWQVQLLFGWASARHGTALHDQV